MGSKINFQLFPHVNFQIFQKLKEKDNILISDDSHNGKEQISPRLNHKTVIIDFQMGHKNGPETRKDFPWLRLEKAHCINTLSTSRSFSFNLSLLTTSKCLNHNLKNTRSTSLRINHHIFLILKHFQNSIIPCLTWVITRIPEGKNLYINSENWKQIKLFHPSSKILIRNVIVRKIFALESKVQVNTVQKWSAASLSQVIAPTTKWVLLHT